MVMAAGGGDGFLGERARIPWRRGFSSSTGGISTLTYHDFAWTVCPSKCHGFAGTEGVIVNLAFPLAWKSSLRL